MTIITIAATTSKPITAANMPTMSLRGDFLGLARGGDMVGAVGAGGGIGAGGGVGGGVEIGEEAGEGCWCGWGV